VRLRLIFVIAAALVAGGWFWFKYLRRREPLTDARALFPAVLAIGLFCRLAFVFFTPIFYAPDEHSHFNYIKYLAEYHSLPVQTHKMGDPAQDWEYSQPPLYYMLLTPVFLLAQAIFHHPAGVALSLRFFSVLLWLLNVWLGFILLNRLQITDSLLRNFVLAMVCLLPTYTFISSVINNDNLLATIGTAILCLLVQRGQSWLISAGLGLLIGLAVLTKQSAVVFFPAIATMFLLDGFHHRLKWSRVLLHLAVILGLAFILSVPWSFRNWRLYGHLTPESLSVPVAAWPFKLYGVLSAVHNMIKTFWAVSGFFNNVGYPFPLVGFIFLWLCLVWRQPATALASEQPAPRVPSPFSLLPSAFAAGCLVAILVNVLLVLRLGYSFGMGQGRHLFALLYPIALFLACRWRTFPVKNLEPYTTGIWILYALGFLVFSLWRFP